MIRTIEFLAALWGFFGLTAMAIWFHIASSLVKRSIDLFDFSLNEARDVMKAFRTPIKLVISIVIFIAAGFAAFLIQFRAMVALWWFLEYAEQRAPRFGNAAEERAWWQLNSGRMVLEFERQLRGGVR